MRDTPMIDTYPDVPSTRKYGNITCHGHKICEADSSKEKSKRFENYMLDGFGFGFDIDQGYRRYLTGMGDTPIIDTYPDVPSESIYGNFKCHGHKECEADSSKEKSKRFENHMFNEFGFDIDQDYRQYLTSDMMSILTDDDCNCNGVNDDAVDNDPQYEIFLGSLTVDGNSYVLQANEKNGLFEPVKYDVEDGYDDELDIYTQRKMKNIIGGNVGDDKFNSSSGYELEAPTVFGYLPDNQRRQSVADNYMRSEPVTSNPLGLDEGLGNGGTYPSDGKCKINVQGEEHKSRILRKSRKVAKGGKPEKEASTVFGNLPDNQRRQSVADNDMRSEPVTSNPFGLDEGLGNGGTYPSDGKCKINVLGEEQKSRILRKSRKVAKGGKPETLVNVKKKKDDEHDDDYQTYCNYLGSDDNNLGLKYKTTSPIKNETDEYLQNFRTNNSTCSMKENTKLPVYAGRSHASMKGDDDCHYLGNPSTESHSPFREQVMRILRKPFDLKEHQMLSQDILARKPIERNMDLRFGREKSYRINKDGKSYLDHYYDLKRKFQAAKSSREELNLLRGFFFWLQNLTQDGAFKPWQDASCLAL